MVALCKNKRQIWGLNWNFVGDKGDKQQFWWLFFSLGFNWFVTSFCGNVATQIKWSCNPKYARQIETSPKRLPKGFFQIFNLSFSICRSLWYRARAKTYNVMLGKSRGVTLKRQPRNDKPPGCLIGGFILLSYNIYNFFGLTPLNWSYHNQPGCFNQGCHLTIYTVEIKHWHSYGKWQYI